MENQEQAHKANDNQADPDFTSVTRPGESAEGQEQQQQQYQDGQDRTVDPDHAEKSRLGRKVSRLEDRIEQLMSFLESRETQSRTPHIPSVPPSELGRNASEEELPEIVATPDDVIRVMELQERKRNMTQQAYEKDYIWATERSGSEINDPDLHQRVVSEMMQNFNKKRTGHPVADAQYNYSLAMRSVLAKDTSAAKVKAQPNLKGDSADGTGVAVQGAADKVKPVQMPKLSPDAAKLAQRLGKTPEWIQQALKEETLTGKAVY